MSRFRWVVIELACVAALLCSPLHAADAAAFQARYDKSWAEREKKAIAKDARMALADDLLAAAGAASERGMKLLLLEKAYAWGSKQSETFAQAAQALDQMRQIDPDRRLRALERLSHLYHQAYSARPRYFLGNGIGLADVRYKTAQQRLIELIERHEKNAMEKSEFLSELNTAKREYVGAWAVANKVIKTAEGYARRTEGKRREALLGFAAEHEPILKRIRSAQDELDELQQTFLAGNLPGGKPEPPKPPAAVAALSPPKQADKPEKEPAVAAVPAPKPAPSPARPTASQDPPKRAVPAPGESEPPKSSAERGVISLLKRTMVCTKCNNKFIPDYGAKTDQCFWCASNRKSIFDLSGLEK